MTSWIWMKGVSVAVADPPSKPVNEHDTRRPVKDLISKHRDAIDEVRAAIESDPHYDPNKHDDLWLVRFVLSHPKKKQLMEAIQAAKHTLEFRALHKLDETDIRFTPVGKSTPNESVQRYMSHCTDDALAFTLPDSRRGVVNFCNAGGINQSALLANLDASEWPAVFRYMTEWQFQWLDYVTRTTGLLTKTARIIDLAEVKLKEIKLEVSKRDGSAMGTMEDTYPQLLHKVYICHAPAWVQIPWRIVRPIMPKRVVTKCDFINPSRYVGEKKKLYAHVDEEHLPARFGGKYTAWPVAFPLPK